MITDIILHNHELQTQTQFERSPPPGDYTVKTTFGEYDPLRNTIAYEATAHFSLDTAVPQKGYVSQLATYSRN